MSDLTLVIGGLASSFAIGWGVGRWWKAVRQFLDNL